MRGSGAMRGACRTSAHRLCALSLLVFVECIFQVVSVMEHQGYVHHYMFKVSQRKQPIRSLSDTFRHHCDLAVGEWCSSFNAQQSIPTKPPPAGNVTCVGDCNGVGTCNHGTGTCLCPAGWTAHDCKTPSKRPCQNMGPNKLDRSFPNFTDKATGFTRCAGLCDDSNAACFCPPTTKYGRVEPPAGSPPGTPPLQRGRPLISCYPLSDHQGNPIPAWGWGSVPYQDILGPDGWCNADKPKWTCPCRLDGYMGAFCEQEAAQTCVNQCYGRGSCLQGFCKCDPGWYGHDCSLSKAGVVEQPVKPPHNVEPVLVNPLPARLHGAARPTRKRPLIYVYDMNPEFTSRLLQYRLNSWACSWRAFDGGNNSVVTGWTYSIEAHLHELMLQSPHRTLDPEEADFFYVPIYSSCTFDIAGIQWNPIPLYPPGFWGPRPMLASNMIREAQRWLAQTFPYWNRTGGRDHIWLMSHDEGACYAPVEVWNSTMLSHWGRLDLNHSSSSGYGPDNYDVDPVHYLLQPKGWVGRTSKAHPCYDPKKDLIIPAFKSPMHYQSSPLAGARQGPRDVLGFFKGDVGKHRNDQKRYSRGIRQALYKLSKQNNWVENHNILIATDESEANGTYSSWLARSIFCFVLPGDGWSPRMEDAVLHGCIPVIIQDNVHLPYENILDYDSFTIRIPEDKLIRVPAVLRNVPPGVVRMMQANLAKVWYRFRWNQHKWVLQTAKMLAGQQNSSIALQEQEEAERRRRLLGLQEFLEPGLDAMQTLMEFLYGKMMSWSDGNKHSTQDTSSTADAGAAGVLAAAAGAAGDSSRAQAPASSGVSGETASSAAVSVAGGAGGAGSASDSAASAVSSSGAEVHSGSAPGAGAASVSEQPGQPAQHGQGDAFWHSAAEALLQAPAKSAAASAVAGSISNAGATSAPVKEQSIPTRSSIVPRVRQFDFEDAVTL